MPSSSARCAQFPRAQDKVHFYIKLRELRDQLRGEASGRAREIEEVAYTFDLTLAKGESPWHLWWLLGTMDTCGDNKNLSSTEDAKRMAIKEEQYDPGYEDAYGGEYAEGGGAEPKETSNGHCAFSSGKVPASSGGATRASWSREPSSELCLLHRRSFRLRPLLPARRRPGPRRWLDDSVLRRPDPRHCRRRRAGPGQQLVCTLPWLNLADYLKVPGLLDLEDNLDFYNLQYLLDNLDLLNLLLHGKSIRDWQV